MAMGFGEFQCNFLFHVDIFVCLFTYLIFLVAIGIREMAKLELNDSSISERNLRTNWGLRRRWKEGHDVSLSQEIQKVD